MAEIKKKKAASMEEEDRLFFEAAMKDPATKKKIEEQIAWQKENAKRLANLPDKVLKKKIAKGK